MVFKEIQRFDQWWLRVLFLIIALIAAGPLLFDYQEVIHSQKELTSVLVSLGIIAALFLAFWYLFKLETKVDEAGIHYRFLPFHGRTRHKPWAEIKELKLTKYHPIKDYGGWGYRIGFGKKKALTVSGRTGIAIYFKNGSRLLLGTQDTARAQEAVDYYKSKL